MERGRHKAICQVIWAGHPDSSLRGQFAVQCVEGRPPWDEELRQMEEQYQPVILDGSQRRATAPTFARPDINRRRRPRFSVQGQAEVTDGIQRVAGKVQELSEYGARISAADRMRPGTDFRLTLNILDISVALKAQVKYLTDNLGMGVEFPGKAANDEDGRLRGSGSGYRATGRRRRIVQSQIWRPKTTSRQRRTIRSRQTLRDLLIYNRAGSSRRE